MTTVTTLKISKMSCGHCARTIETAVKEIGGSGKVNLQTETLVVEFDDSKVSLESIKKVIEQHGYGVNV